MLASWLLAALLTSAAPGPVEPPSAEDCAVLAQVMRDGAIPTDAAFFPDYHRPRGGTYRQACPWRALGVTPRREGGPASRAGFALGRPTYSGGGLRAQVVLSIFLRAKGPDGRERPPFMTRSVCTLTKTGGRWGKPDCGQGAIT